ncbi:MAG: tetratricopeptide repeat protein [Acidimicrobiales bacterium]
MIGDLMRGHRQYPTPGLADLVARPAVAAQVVVDARKAEGEGRRAEAADGFDMALELLDRTVGSSTFLLRTRAAAQAGKVRSLGTDPLADGLRQEALEWFATAPEDDLDGTELADHASLLDDAQPERRRLVEAAIVRGQPPVWVAYEMLPESSDPERRRLTWGIALRAPMVAANHALVAELEAISNEDTAAELAIAAGLLLADDDRASARRCAELALQLDGENAAAALVMADVLRLDGEAGDAIPLLELIEAESEADSELARSAIRARARALEAIGRRRDALGAIDSVLDSGALPGDCLFAGRLHTALGARDAARLAFDQALARQPDGVPVVYASVVDWLRRDCIDLARRDIEQALAWKPREALLVVLLGHVEARVGLPGAPEEQIAQAVALGLDPVEAWKGLSFIRNDQGDKRGAAQALARALEGREDDPALLYEFAGLLLELNDDDAVPVLRRAARASPGDLDIQERLADALFRAERPEEAVRALDRALKRFRGELILRAWRGKSHRLANDLDAAEQDLRAAVAEVDLDWANAELFWVLAAKHDVAHAVDWARVALSAPKVANLAVELWNAGDFPGALALAEAVLEHLDPYEGVARSQLLLVRGMGSWQNGDATRAETSLREAVSLAEYSGELRAFLASYLASDLASPDQAEEAVVEARHARALDPASESVATRAVGVLQAVLGNEAALEELDKAIFYIGEALDLLALKAEMLLELDPAQALDVTTNAWTMGSTDARVLRVEALALAALGPYEMAATKLGAILEQRPEDLEVRVNLATALNAIGSSRAALTILKELRENEIDESILVLRGQIRRKLGERGCLAHFEEALARDPGLVAARTELVEAATEFGDRELAQKHLQVLVEDPELDDEAEVARLAWILDDADLALARLEKSLAKDPSSAWMLTLKSAILYEREEYEAAIANAGDALALEDDLVLARTVLSGALQATGRPAEALVVLRDEQDVYVVRQRIAVLIALGRRDEATAVLESALEGQADPYDDDQWATLGSALVDGGLLRPVARLLVARLETVPPPAILRLAGSVLMAMGRFDLAVPALERARAGDKRLRVDSDLTWAYSNLEPPQPQEALRAADRALKRQPGDLDLLKAKADALLQLGRKATAERIYKSVLATLSSSASARGRNWVAGWCQYRLGNYSRALDHLLRSISASTSRDGADRFDLGLVLLVSGHTARAKREYGEALKEAEAVGDPLRAAGLVHVALIDLVDAVERGSDALDVTVARDLKRQLATQRAALTREGSRDVRPFLKRMEALTGTVTPAASSGSG